MPSRIIGIIDMVLPAFKGEEVKHMLSDSTVHRYSRAENY